jgi:hypothetical protein
VPRFVARVARNVTARRHVLPAYKGRGRCPSSGERVRRLPRTHKGKTIAATSPDAIAQWVVAGRRVQAQVWDNLVLSTTKPAQTQHLHHEPQSGCNLWQCKALQHTHAWGSNALGSVTLVSVR